jgi:lipid-A-disaccharide synthase
VGHPLAESVARTLEKPPAEMPWPAGEGGKVALLPGSRRMEIERIFPAMLDAAAELRRRRPGTRFLVAAAGEEAERMARAALAARGNPEWVGVAAGAMRDVVRTADAAMVCSGTATVETGLLGCPMIVVYRAAGLTYWLGKRLIKVKWLGMVNLILGRTLCPEFIQDDARADAMADAVEALLGDTPERRAQVEGLAAVRRALSGAGVAGPGTLVARELGVDSGVAAAP